MNMFPPAGAGQFLLRETKKVAMVPLYEFWLPILVSAVIVFIASSIIHMVFKYHNTDFGKLPDEDKVMEALQAFDIPPGDYAIPRAGSMAEMKSQDYLNKMNKGPVAFMTVVPSGPPRMAKNLALWFLYSIIVGTIAAYVTSRATGPDAEYLSRFRFAGCTAFTGYSIALLQNSIWYKRNWAATIKSMFDGLIYALLTAGTFGWLWP